MEHLYDIEVEVDGRRESYSMAADTLLGAIYRALDYLLAAGVDYRLVRITEVA